MILQFSFQDMLTALEKIGYECKLEEEVEVIDFPGGSEERPFKVWNAYCKGNKMTDAGFDRLGGTQRIERIFKMELTKRILNLF